MFHEEIAVVSVQVMYHSIQKILMGLFFSLQAVFSGAQTDSVPRPDSTLLKEITAQPPGQYPASQTGQARTAPATLPDISAIGDFRGSYTRKNKFDSRINEVELSFQSAVDPYARADFFLSVSRDPETGKFGLDLEEGFLTTLSLPGHLQLKAGKFRGALGRINPVHPHTLPFISLPVGYENYFGEGINSDGLSLSWLIPNSFFYQELVIQVTAWPADNPSFIGTGGKWLKLAHLKNFFDLSDNATFEVGLTGITGTNLYGFTTNMAAIDLTYKWKPVQFNTYRSFTWQTEAWLSNADTLKTKAVNTFGLYSFLNYQISKRWFITGTFSHSNRPYSTRVSENSCSATMGWYATEFQKIEFEGRAVTNNIDKNLFQVLLRWIFVIGTHGAHQY